VTKLKSFKSLMVLSTALALVATVAMASDNASYVAQDGDGNVTLVTQSGIKHEAGSAAAVMGQDGDNNRLVIDQTNAGSGNIGGNVAGTSGLGIDQIGNFNILEITQSDQKNAVRQVQQIGSNAGTELSNRAIVSQTHNSQVSRILQQNEGDGSDAANANVIDVLQGGTGNKIGTLSGFGPTVGLTQIGTANDMNIDQLSSHNEMTLAVQDGERNALTVLQQTGNSNDALRLDQIGDDNIISVRQTGANNAVSNVYQTGDGNAGTIDQVGDYNAAAITQSGDDNDTSVVQTGNSNDVLVAETGDGNLLSIIQTGNSNDVSVTLDGDNNNASSFAAFFGAAGGLMPGDIVQTGNDNQATLTTGLFADNNVFAFKQDGNGNQVTGAIDGDANQALVIQVGNTNLVSFSQTGGSNFVSITQ
jgi:hypothetical protein